MKRMKYLLLVTIVFTACHSVHKTASLQNDFSQQPTLAGTFHTPKTDVVDEPNSIETPLGNEAVVNIANSEKTETLSKVTKTKAAFKKAESFSQLKEMAANGDIKMSKKDVRTLNKLEKHYKGDYQKFKADAFELTTKAKIIGAIGLLGLLLGIFAGSAFGWFIFILSALAFLLRYLDIIAF